MLSYTVYLTVSKRLCTYCNRFSTGQNEKSTDLVTFYRNEYIVLHDVSAVIKSALNILQKYKI